MSLKIQKHYLHFITFFLLSFAVSSVYAVPIYSIDNKIGQELLGNSSDAAETQALADILGVDVSTIVLDLKVESGFTPVDNDLLVDNSDTTNSWYLDVAPTTPGWFLLKFGTGNTGASADTFYFQNIGDLTKLVWQNSQVLDLSTDLLRLSHFTTFNPNSVPEPTMVGLLAIGLLGMVVARRRMKV